MGGSLASKTGPPVGHSAPPTLFAEMKKVAVQGYIQERGDTPVAHALIGSVPVSYTHLDVYKRQVLHGAGSSMCWAILM